MSRGSTKAHIRKGDTVVAISGADRGKRGRVLQVMPAGGRALVEGMHIIKKHMRKTQDNPQGGIVSREAPIAISNLRKYQADEEKASGKTGG